MSLHAILNAISASVIVHQGERIRFANAAAQTLTGYDADAFAALPLSRLVAPESQAALAAGTGELKLFSAQGQPFWVNFHAQPVDYEGEAATLCTLGDRREHPQAVLLDNPRLVQHIASTITDAIRLYDVQGQRSLYTNREFTHILGYTRQALEQLGESLRETLMHPDDFAHRRQHAQRLLQAQDGEIIEDESRWRHADGSWRWIYTRDLVFARNPDGSPRQILGIAQDVTERKRAQDALRRSEERLQYLLTNAPVAIFSADPSGDFDVRFVSENVVRLTGFTPQELISDPSLWKSRIHPEDLRWVHEKLNETLTTGENSYEYRFLCKDDTYKWTHEEVRLIRHADGQPLEIVGYWQDITQRKDMERALVLQERLQVALQKEKELGDLKSKMMERISHEFRTPLSVITMSSELLERHHDRMTPEKRQQHFQRIRHGVVQIASLLDDTALAVKGLADYLDFVPVPLDLTRLCQDIADEARATLASTHRLDLLLPSEPLHVTADRDLVRRILLNLLHNAVKFSPSGTAIRLEAASEDVTCLLRIHDQGIGIHPEDQARIFEPFYRGSNIGERQGLGLGLCIVQNAVDLHQGTLHVHSAPGQGATFTVRLPLSP